MTKKLIALLFISVALIFPNRAFKSSRLGTRLSALGGASAAVLDAPEAMVYNPALLSGVYDPTIFYEINASVLVNALRWDWTVNFDALSIIGYAHPFKRSSLGFSFASLYTGASADSKEFSLRQLGLTYSFKVSKKFSLGITPGFIIASDKDDSSGTRNYAPGFALSAGLYAIPLEKRWIHNKRIVKEAEEPGGEHQWETNYRSLKYALGLSVSSPVKLSWENYRGYSKIEERMPFSIRFGNSLIYPFETVKSEPVKMLDEETGKVRRVSVPVARTNVLKVYLDFEYLGFSSYYYDADGTVKSFDDVEFSFGKSFQPHFGIEIYDAGLFSRSMAGGIYRLGFSPAAFTTSGGNIITRYNITAGMTVFAGDYFKVSFSIIDTLVVEGILELAERISDKNIREDYDTTEELRVAVEIDTAIFSAQGRKEGAEEDDEGKESGSGGYRPDGRYDPRLKN